MEKYIKMIDQMDQEQLKSICFKTIYGFIYDDHTNSQLTYDQLRHQFLDDIKKVTAVTVTTKNHVIT